LENKGYIVGKPGGKMEERSKRLSLPIKILIGILVLFLALQFIRPAPNRSTGVQTGALGMRYPVPADVNDILRRSCFDCHSNNTSYPWYSYVEPIGWWLNGHIADAKAELNFDEFLSYHPSRQIRKFESIKTEVEEGKMPLPSYTLIHTSASLTPAERSLIVNWANAMQDTMKDRYPIDSLQRPPRTM
jgi:hypothetical protein